MGPRGNTTNSSVPSPRDSTADTLPPPPGGAYNAETVVRSVPRELLMELNYALKPPKVPAIEVPRADVEVDAEVTTATPASREPLPTSRLTIVTPPRDPVAGWLWMCLLFVAAITSIALCSSR